MGFQKFGTGAVTGTEDAVTKTAVQTEGEVPWTDDDEHDLAEESGQGEFPQED